MNQKTKEALLKSNLKFKLELEEQNLFFDKPEALKILKKSGIAFFNEGIAALESEFKIALDTQLSKLLKDNKISDSIIKHTSNEIYVGEICKTETDINPINVTPIEEISDNEANQILDKIKNRIAQTKKFISDNIETVEIVVGASLLLLHIYKEVKKVFTTSEHPSKYRSKYLQGLIRNTYKLLKAEYKISKKEFNTKINKLLKSLKKLDEILIGVLTLTSMYLINRKILQKKSKQTLDDITKDTNCTTTPEPSDPSINSNPFVSNLNCPVIIDDVLVPHVPIEVKMSELSCDVPLNENINDEPTVANDLTTYAIIRNLKASKITVLVTKDSLLNQTTPIANIDGKVIYSPVIGEVEKITANEIIIRNISEPTEDYLTTQINLLGEKYEKLSDDKLFLKTYYTSSLYPRMLIESSLHSPTFGIKKLFDDTLSREKKLVKNYDKTIKAITQKDNVEFHAKNESLIEIKNQVEKETNNFYNNLDVLGRNAINIVKGTVALPAEFMLFEYYNDLAIALNSIETPSSNETKFIKIINEYVGKRLVLEQYSKEKLEGKINDKIKDIEKGISLGNWFNKALNIYYATRKLSEVKSWLTGLAQENSKLEDPIGDVNRIMYLFEFYLKYDETRKKYISTITPNMNPKGEAIIENNVISSFIETLWKELKQLIIEIEQINAIIDSTLGFKTYSMTKYEDYSSRLYVLIDEPKCQSKETDNYVNPKGKYGIGDIEYWLKYCSYATLASVSNPATGWSTGWIVPAPILFPVVYIPIKVIETKYGFTVIGISICGIWVFPWVLLGNLTSNNNTPFGDPTALLKKEIDALKKQISINLKSLKKEKVKEMQDSVKKEIDLKDATITVIKDNISKQSSLKPKKSEKTLRKNLQYDEDYLKWVGDTANLKKDLLKAKIEKLALVRKYKILNNAYNSGASVKGIDGLEQSEKLITKQLDNLSSLIDNTDKVLGALPIAMKPYTANFGITLKNTKPIINIAKNLEDNVNDKAVNSILEKFKLKNKDLISTNYDAKLKTSAINYKLLTKTFSAANLLTVKQDPFPKYELISLKNIQFIKFLYKDFVTTGAKTYGFPGQLPIPI